MKEILLVEDEKPFARFMELELKHEGFAVSCAYDGESGLKLAMEREWDLILLDVMLPGIDGTDVCRRIRTGQDLTPIIMITARDAVTDRILGLECGADDYLPKPFAIGELLARMRAMLRRSGQAAPAEAPLVYRDIRMDVESMTVHQGERLVDLTKREFDILRLFLQHAGEVVARDVLLDEIWGTETQVETNVVDVYISYLRSKLHPKGENSYIVTVRGTGYKLQ
ncbi:response regulator transcription factor [Paenibacillus filicis]|uniref:Response regulator transcription factor n=1 Tax=Paenibacillus gyeongsangnamensis TaxID=3388067 RepID=A0ABT4QA53_9BACL|nr:response regulator transcription factor [Paenibacillus filicis]MCZ8513768.1 response regulator transcription factor [Paenibacillus filicis]